MALRTNKLAKKKASTAVKDAMRTEIEVFLTELVSDNNPEAARIGAYSVDDKSGNTLATAAASLYFIITKVRLLGDLGTIVLQTEIGTSVVVTRAL